MLGIANILLFLLLQRVSVFAEEKDIPSENIDCDVVRAICIDSNKPIEKKEKYLFMEKSAGRDVPLQIDADGVMYYYFSSEKVNLLDNKKRIIFGDSDDEMAYNPATGMRVAMIPVKKNKQYYIQLPDFIIETEYEVYAYIYPNPIKKLENEKVYAVEGRGKYVYYPFDIKKKPCGFICKCYAF